MDPGRATAEVLVVGHQRRTAILIAITDSTTVRPTAVLVKGTEGTVPERLSPGRRAAVRSGRTPEPVAALSILGGAIGIWRLRGDRTALRRVTSTGVAPFQRQIAAGVAGGVTALARRRGAPVAITADREVSRATAITAGDWSIGRASHRRCRWPLRPLGSLRTSGSLSTSRSLPTS